MISSTEQLPDDHIRVTYEEIHVQIAQTAKLIKKQFDPDVIVAISGGGLIPARILRTFLKKPSAYDPNKKRNVPIQAIGLALYEEVSGSSAENMGREVVRTQWLDEGTFGKRSRRQDRGEDGAKEEGLLGKRILIVDEVDDSRTTLQYAYQELLKDVKAGLEALDPEARAQLPPTRCEYAVTIARRWVRLRCKFTQLATDPISPRLTTPPPLPVAIFVVHNKGKESGKRGVLPLLPSQSVTSTLDDQPAAQGGSVAEGVWYYPAGETGDVWVDYPWETEDIVEHNRLANLAQKLGVNQVEKRFAGN